MSAKNVKGTDFHIKDLTGVPTTNVGVAIYTFTANRSGYVFISCKYNVLNPDGDQTCTVSVQLPGNLVEHYTGDVGARDSGYGELNCALAVEKDSTYSIMGSSSGSLNINSGMCLVKYM
jgi:hypothetical protein